MCVYGWFLLLLCVCVCFYSIIAVKFSVVSFPTNLGMCVIRLCSNESRSLRQLRHTYGPAILLFSFVHSVGFNNCHSAWDESEGSFRSQLSTLLRSICLFHTFLRTEANAAADSCTHEHSSMYVAPELSRTHTCARALIAQTKLVLYAANRAAIQMEMSDPGASSFG